MANFFENPEHNVTHIPQGGEGWIFFENLFHATKGLAGNKQSSKCVR